MESRQNISRRLAEYLEQRKIKNFLITNLTNIKYLTGFTGSSAYLLLNNGKQFLFTDFRYKEQSSKEVQNANIIITKKDHLKYIVNFMKILGIKETAVEDTIIYRTFEKLSKELNVTSQKEIIENLRSIKEKEEIECLKKAVLKAQKAFIKIKDNIKEGTSEKQIALKLEESLKKEGTYKLPFEVIVASGANSSLPHAKPTEKEIEKGDLVIIDWGGEHNGYFSDMTRTFLINGPNIERKKEIYNTVLQANIKARQNMKKGMTTSEIDSLARNQIKEKGYGDFFGHGLGHGVGLDIHELPYISQNSTETTLDNAMVFTVEPGIYIPSLGGVRIEDMVVLLNDKPNTLTDLPRDLEVIPTTGGYIDSNK
ncbi:peptidase M24 [Candidatus Magnetoovum chiemensis]|nr:peptidase M24 [Candidatus Magnetoovum chiemensis]